MTAPVEKKDLVITAPAGAFVSYGVGTLCAFGAKEIYVPVVHSIDLLKGQCAQASQRAVGDAGVFSMLLGHRDTSALVDQIEKVVQVSQKVGIRSAFWAGTVETAVNFLRSLKSKESRPLVLDMVEGGMRGSLIGIGTGVCSTNEGPKAVQILTGAGIGFSAGMIGAFFGHLSGYFVKKFI